MSIADNDPEETREWLDALRESVAAGHSVRYLSPDPVVDYITAHHLYR